MEGLEPTHLAAPDPKSGMSTNFTTSAVVFQFTVLELFPKGSAKIEVYFELRKF
jgi:hypothetical protein